jgi:hypothetical protein
MGLLHHPQTPDLTRYVIKGKYVRHPIEGNKYPFSRDQLIPLVAGLRAQGYRNFVDIAYDPENGDWISPSQRDHIMRCRGMADSWLGKLWLNADIAWAKYINPEAELNQLIAMLVIAGPEYVRKFKHNNKSWQLSLQNYWCTWRNEKEFCEFMIDMLERI